MKLQVDFVSQVGNETAVSGRNDCGAAAVAMATSRTVDQVLTDVQQPGNKPLHVQTIMSALRAYHVPNEYARPLSLPRLRENLVQGYPVIALVNYARLPRQLKADPDYNDNHFVVVVGFTADGHFLVHDPLWANAERGAYRRWTDITMGESLAFVRDAMPMQGVVVQRPFPVQEVAAGDVAPLVAEVAREQATVYLEQLLGAMEIEAGSMAERVGHALARITSWKS